MHDFELPVDYIPNGDGTGKPVWNPETSRVRVQFSLHKTLDRPETLRQGKQIFKERLVILKQAYRDTNIVADLATEIDRQRYSKEYKVFSDRERGDLGEPVSHLSGVLPAQVAQLHYYGVYTVEQLAELDAEQLANIDGGAELQQLAKIMLKDSDSSIIVVEEFKKRTEELELELAEAKREIRALKKKPKKGGA